MTDTKQPESHTALYNACQEILRLEQVNAELLEALKGLDEAYCRFGAYFTKEERQEDRMRLIKARAAIAKAEGSV